MPGWHRSCKLIFMSTTFPAPRDPGRDPEHPLARAFASFTEAAGSLERTYGQLQGQVAHLRQELEVTNRDLATSLEENHRIRERLRRILEGLPCGVLVIEAGARISALNPEAARLLGANFESADRVARRTFRGTRSGSPDGRRIRIGAIVAASWVGFVFFGFRAVFFESVWFESAWFEPVWFESGRSRVGRHPPRVAGARSGPRHFGVYPARCQRGEEAGTRS